MDPKTKAIILHFQKQRTLTVEAHCKGNDPFIVTLVQLWFPTQGIINLNLDNLQHKFQCRVKRLL